MAEMTGKVENTCIVLLSTWVMQAELEMSLQSLGKYNGHCGIVPLYLYCSDMV